MGSRDGVPVTVAGILTVVTESSLYRYVYVCRQKEIYSALG